MISYHVCFLTVGWTVLLHTLELALRVLRLRED